MRTFVQKQNQPQKRISSSLARSNTPTSGLDIQSHPILHLQRTVGNQAVLRLLQQAQPDNLEVASATTAVPFDHGFNPTSVPPHATNDMQTQSAASAFADVHEQEGDGVVGEVLRSPGQALDPATRAFMEQRFGHEFSNVRLHSDAQAAHSAKARNAAAYTVGNHIVFGSGRHAPQFEAGRRLIAHELAHVIQQTRPGPSRPNAAHEAEAEAAASAPRSARFNVSLASPPNSLQCSPDEKRSYNSGRREAVIQIVWSQDSWDLGDRLVAAVARHRAFHGIPESSLPQVLNHAAGVLTSDPANARLKPGHRVGIRVAMVYDPERIPELSSVSVTIAETASPTSSAKQPPVAAGSQPASPPGAETRAAGRAERTDPTLEDQEATLLRTYSQLAATADHNGNDGIVFVVDNNGRALRPTSFEVLGKQQARPAGIAEMSPQSATAELRNPLDTITQYPGQWRVTLLRDPTSKAMHFKRIERIAGPATAPRQPSTPQRQLTASEQFEMETGVIDPRRINQQLHDIAAQALKESNPFSLKNLPYTIAGVVIPMGAMKLVMMDSGELSGLIRLEWQIDETLIEQGEAGATAKSATVREIQVGDIIETPQGTQRVVEVRPGKRLVTEPHTETVAAEAKTTPAPPQTAEKPATPASQPTATQPSKPLLSAEELNKPVPQDRGAVGPKRMLTPTERKNANSILKVLERVRNGEQAALAELANFRVKPLTGNLTGWYEIDLLEGNPGALNQMRLLVKLGKGGAMEARLLQMH